MPSLSGQEVELIKDTFQVVHAPAFTQPETCLRFFASPLLFPIPSGVYIVPISVEDWYLLPQLAQRFA